MAADTSFTLLGLAATSVLLVVYGAVRSVGAWRALSRDEDAQRQAIFVATTLREVQSRAGRGEPIGRCHSGHPTPDP